MPLAIPLKGLAEQLSSHFSITKMEEYSVKPLNHVLHSTSSYRVTEERRVKMK